MNRNCWLVTEKVMDNREQVINLADCRLVAKTNWAQLWKRSRKKNHV